MTVEITDKMVAFVMRKLSGSVGTGVTDLVSFQHWMFWFGWQARGYGRFLGNLVTGWSVAAHPG